MSEPAERVGRRRMRVALSACGLLLALAAAAAVWHPIVRNYFFLDDFILLNGIVEDSLGRLLLEPHGGHVCILRNLVAWVTHWVCGVEPRGWFLVVWAGHLVCVGLLWWAVRNLSDSASLATVAALAWGTTPMHEGTLGWYAVFGQVIATACALAVVADATWGAVRGETASLRCRDVAGSLDAPSPWLPSRLRMAVWCGLLLAGAVSFGTGAGVAMAAPFALVGLVGLVGRVTLRARRRVFLGLACLWVVVPAVWWGVHAVNARLMGRMNVEVPLLLAYAKEIDAVVWMLAAMIPVGVSGLFAGFWMPSDVLTSVAAIPRGTLLAFLGALALVIVGALARAGARQRLGILACLFLSMAAYGTVAMGRAGLFASRATLAAGTGKLRYQYEATALLAVAVATSVGALARRASFPDRALWPSGLLVAAALAVGGIGWQRSDWEIEHHLSTRRITAMTMHKIAEAAREASVDPVVIRNEHFIPAGYVAPTSFPGTAAVFAIFSPTNVVEGRRVVFAESDPAVLAMARRGRRLHPLVVAATAKP